MRLTRVGVLAVVVAVLGPVPATRAAAAGDGDGSMRSALEAATPSGGPDAKGRLPAEVSPPELQALEHLGPDSTMPADPSASLRYEAMKEVAYTLGVQSGVRWRYGVIAALLESNQTTLDRVFDFRPLLLHDGRVAPAVVERTDGAYRLVSPTEARQTEATYTIEQEARLISRPPDWRDYLVHNYPTFTKPDPAMLPRDEAERQIWSKSVASGWRAGVVQAERLFDTHLARLRHDYLGMARFKLLALQGIVDVPLLAESHLGVVVNGRMLSVGERAFRIPPVTDFQPVRSWKPILQYIPAGSGAATGSDPDQARSATDDASHR